MMQDALFLNYLKNDHEKWPSLSLVKLGRPFWLTAYPFIFILFMTFSLVNSSLSFSSSALVMVYTSSDYMGMVIFCSALARFCVFLILEASRYAAFSTMESLMVKSFTLRNASRAVSMDSRVVLKE